MFVMQYNPVVGADMNIYACHNQAYSDGGFTQVNQDMAKIARDIIQEKVKINKFCHHW